MVLILKYTLNSMTKYILVLGLICYAVECRYVDLSYPFNAKTLYWPGGGTFELEILERGRRGGKDGYWYESNKFAAPEHGGTHMDALSHFVEGKWRIGDFPINMFFANAVVMNISAKAEQDSNAELEIEDVLRWEQDHGPIPDGSILFIYTGWGQRWPNETAYFGNDRGDLANFHFTGVNNFTSQWLVDNRKLKAVGMDTPSPDCGQCVGGLTHRILLPASIYIIENVANLGELPPNGADVFVFPMKIGEGSGAPTRIIAEIHDSLSAGALNTRSGTFLKYLIALLLIIHVNVL